MRITKSAVVFGVLLGGVAPLEAQLQSSNPPEQAWIQGGTLPDVAEEGDSLSGYYSYQRALATGDFNGDTIMDLAIGVPYEDVSSGPSVLTDAGIVHVVYGRSGGGLDPTTAQTLGQGTGGLLDSPASDEYFGRELASGDFDGDGVDDLAIGVTGQKIGGLHLAGAVHIVYGEKGLGLGVRNHVLYQGLFPNSDQAEANDSFGWSLAAGDFNGDLIDDLAVGAHGDSVAGFSYAGLVVEYLALAKDGLANPICGVVTQDRIPGGVNEANDQFGWALAAGDFDGDGKDDLAFGTPFEDVGSTQDAGFLTVVYGDWIGLNLNHYQTFNQQTLKEVFEPGDRLGYALAVGDFNGNGVDDLAVGAPYEDLGGDSDCGIVHTLYGYVQTGGLDPGGWLSQDTYLMKDGNDTKDHFAIALAAGDFDRDGNDDLAIGVPGEDYYSGYSCGSADASGAVSVVHGSLFGLHTKGNQFWTQCAPYVDSSPEPGDRFGSSLTAGDFDGNGAADLTIGVGTEDYGPGQTDCGFAHTLYGVPAQ